MVGRGGQSDMTVIRVSGHFGELMQGRLGPQGPVVLLTLPCRVLGVQATWVAGPGFSITPSSAAIMTEKRARKLLEKLNLSLSGQLGFESDMPPGGGAGVSTAALVALARLAGFNGDPMVLARACVAVEGASDPLMLSMPLQTLWASRQAEAKQTLPPSPEMEIVGGFYGPTRRTDPQDFDFPDIADLIPAWTLACMAGDLPTVAALASTSAQRSLMHRGAQSDPTASLAADLGALGHVIAHTGSARGLIFAPGQVPDSAAARLQSAGMSGVIQFRAGGGR